MLVEFFFLSRGGGVRLLDGAHVDARSRLDDARLVGGAPTGAPHQLAPLVRLVAGRDGHPRRPRLPTLRNINIVFFK